MGSSIEDIDKEDPLNAFDIILHVPPNIKRHFNTEEQWSHIINTKMVK